MTGAFRTATGKKTAPHTTLRGARASVRFVNWQRRLAPSPMVEANTPNTESCHAKVLTSPLIPIGANDDTFTYAFRIVRELEMPLVCVLKIAGSRPNRLCEPRNLTFIESLKRSRIAGRDNLLSQHRVTCLGRLVTCSELHM